MCVNLVLWYRIVAMRKYAFCVGCVSLRYGENVRWFKREMHTLTTALESLLDLPLAGIVFSLSHFSSEQ